MRTAELSTSVHRVHIGYTYAASVLILAARVYNNVYDYTLVHENVNPFIF